MKFSNKKVYLLLVIFILLANLCKGQISNEDSVRIIKKLQFIENNISINLNENKNFLSSIIEKNDTLINNYIFLYSTYLLAYQGMNFSDYKLTKKYLEILSNYKITNKNLYAKILYVKAQYDIYVNGNYNSALKYLDNALFLADSLNNLKQKTKVLILYGNLYSFIEDIEQALQYYNSASKIAIKNNYKNEELIILLNTGLMYNIKGDFVKSTNILNRIIAEAKKNKLPRIENLGYRFIGDVYTSLEQYDTAFIYLKKARSYFKEYDNKLRVALCNNNLAQIYTNLNELDSALYYLLETKNIANEINSINLKKWNYLRLSGIYEKKNDIDEAYFYLKKYVTINDSVINNEKMREYARLESNFKNKILLKEKKINELKIINQERKLYFSTIIIISLLFLASIIIIFIIVLHKQRRQKDILKAYANGIEEEDERIAQELHDAIAVKLALIENKISVKNPDLQSIKKELNDVYQHIRIISHKMSTSLIDLIGFSETIEQFLNEINQNSQISIHFISNKLPKIDKETEVHLYRIIQEATQNTLKHSGANHLDIQMHLFKNKISLTIEDNGDGFDAAKKASGIGIQNIKNRVASLNGKFELISSSEGTFINIQVRPKTIN